MAGPFFKRLRDYYEKVGEVLRGEAAAATIFPNSIDIGTSRERIYAEFLRQHSPSKCNVFYGGFLFDEVGNESKQIDVIITTDTCPQFNFHNPDGEGKTFTCVEGTLACASIKSFLDKAQIEDALNNLGSIPPTMKLDGRVIPLVQIKNYEDWPFKVLYASNGLKADTIVGHLQSFYAAHPTIPKCRMPNLIHVAGKYLILRVQEGVLLDGIPPSKDFCLSERNPDIQAIIWTINGIQERASGSNYILFRYDFLTHKIHEYS
jgi:Domain of unknown function (DUF6602)